ncbi:hypothetical protein [Bacillus sp. NPDC094106]|uniref:hypothetical protein n=1 Tax=Bacillus sp. NPDC094106 TaxID=3363949 RepID=UPI003819BF0F
MDDMSKAFIKIAIGMVLLMLMITFLVYFFKNNEQKHNEYISKIRAEVSDSIHVPESKIILKNKGTNVYQAETEKGMYSIELKDNNREQPKIERIVELKITTKEAS